MNVAARGYPGAHYATFPPDLITPLIASSCPRWACPVCGLGWAPVVDEKFIPQDDVSAEKAVRGTVKPSDDGQHWDGYTRGSKSSEVQGYRATCEHPHTLEETVPGIVFDPFVGSGTTVMVAKQLLRRGIGMDLSMPYLDEQAKVRTGSGTPSNALEGLPLFEQAHED